MDDLAGVHIEQTIQVDVEDIEIDPEEEETKHAERKILKEQVWREMLLSSNGRDKAFVRLHTFLLYLISVFNSVRCRFRCLFTDLLSSLHLRNSYNMLSVLAWSSTFASSTLIYCGDCSALHGKQALYGV